MTSLLEDLSRALEAKTEQSIVDKLQQILAQGTNIELENDNEVKRIIALNNSNITKVFVEVAAEWCKHERNRKIFTDRTTIEFLFRLLESGDEQLKVGAIRALGNICYENEDARNVIDNRRLATVLSILESDQQRTDHSLTLKASGFMVNLLVNNDQLQKAALKLNVVNVVEGLLVKYTKSFKENEMLVTFLLTILDNVIDYIDEQNVPFSDSLCRILIDIFKLSNTPEVSVSCLEILHGQSDKDEIKTMLAKNGICELIYDLIGKYKSRVNDEESRSVLKMACDMIVIILTGDDCMNLLYGEGKGKLYKNMVTWLDSDDADLLSTGVLALGNFARKDTHCIQMVQNGISKKLLGLLSKYNTTESDLKIQHALLSTLKNLVIPLPNKAKILEEGLIDVLYPMINIEQHLVIFKLLGTFRMVIDGQEKAALDLISRKEFLEKLAFWCYTCDNLGVRGEVPRLMAWLIKHCHSFKPFKSLVRVQDCVKCLVEMTSSNHAVMQNESYYALTLLCIGCTHNYNHSDGKSNGISESSDCEEARMLFDQLVEAEIGKNLAFVVNKYSDKMDKHTIENLLSLLEQIVSSREVCKHLKETGVDVALHKLSSNENAQKDKIQHILDRL